MRILEHGLWEENKVRSRSNAARRNLNSTQVTIHMSTTVMASRMPKTTGWCVASQRAAMTRPSSNRLASTLDKGSGEVLMAARVVVLAAWLLAASVPPMSAATRASVVLSAPKTPAASAAPAGIRITLLTRSHSESSPGILSAKKLDEQQCPTRRQHHGVLQHLQSGRQGDPARSSHGTHQEHHGVQTETTGPTKRSSQRQQAGHVERLQGLVHSVCS
jgi:hypothetical protein